MSHRTFLRALEAGKTSNKAAVQGVSVKAHSYEQYLLFVYMVRRERQVFGECLSHL